MLKTMNSPIANKLIPTGKSNTIEKIGSSNDMINKVNMFEVSIISNTNIRTFNPKWLSLKN